MYSKVYYKITENSSAKVISSDYLELGITGFEGIDFSHAECEV